MNPIVLKEKDKCKKIYEKKFHKTKKVDQSKIMMIIIIATHRQGSPDLLKRPQSVIMQARKEMPRERRTEQKIQDVLQSDHVLLLRRDPEGSREPHHIEAVQGRIPQCFLRS